MQLQGSLEAIRSEGVELVAVSNDPVKISKGLSRKLKLEFPILADPELETIRTWGVFDEKNGVAWPSVFLVARDGTIVWRNVAPTYKVADRPTPEEVVDAVSKFGRSKPADIPDPAQ